MKKKTDIFLNLSVIAYIISGFTSLIFLTGFGVKAIDKFLCSLITILFEVSKPLTFVQVFKKHSKTMKNVFKITWIILEIASIVASTSYMINQTNANYMETPAYKAIEAKEKNIKSLIDADKASLKIAMKNLSKAIDSDKTSKSDNTKLVSQYNSNIKTLQSKINIKNNELQGAINRNSKNPCPATIKRLKGEISSIEKQLDTTSKARDGLTADSSVSEIKTIITSTNSSIEKNTKALNSIDYSNISNNKQTDGYMSMFVIVGGIIKVNPEILSFIFFIVIFGILPELLGNLFYYLHKKENGEILIDEYENYNHSGGDNSINNNIPNTVNARGNNNSNISNDSNSLNVGKHNLKSNNGQNTVNARGNNNSNISNDSNSLNVGKHNLKSNNGQSQSQTNIQRKTIKGFVFEKPEIEVKIKPDIEVDLSKKPEIKPDFEALGIKESDVNLYLNKMYSTKKLTKRGLESIGYKKISGLIGITDDTGRNIKGYLNYSGIVKSVGAITFILKDKK